MGRHLTTGYSQLFDFLDNLAVNNDRQWFAENRQLYDCLRKQWLADLQTLIGHMAQSEPALRHTDAASCAYTAISVSATTNRRSRPIFRP